VGSLVEVSDSLLALSCGGESVYSLVVLVVLIVVGVDKLDGPGNIILRVVDGDLYGVVNCVLGKERKVLGLSA